MKYVYIIFFAALLLVACAKTPETPTPAPMPVPEAEEPVPEMIVEEAQPNDGDNDKEVESGLDKAFGTIDASLIIGPTDVICDEAAKSLKFRFRNAGSGETSWQLNQDVPFPAPSGLASVRIMINNYEANKRGGYYRGDELLFGPNAKFSENCGGVEVLAPGEEITCTLTNAPLLETNSYAGGINEIYVDTPGQGARVRFTCDQ